jgi:gamma-glutamyltranspeptidase/glutathione hydrolase
MVDVSRSDRRVGAGTVLSKGGMVCSISPQAASAGASVLRDGGNAFDAAVATAAVEGVTAPSACGLGGEPFVLMYEAKTGKTFGLSGSGKAPMAATRDYFVSRGYQTMPLSGPLAAAIPGEVDAYVGILERYGTRPLSKLLEPAIGYAEEGYPISERQARGFESSAERLTHYPDTKRIFTKDGKPYLPGDVLVQTNLAQTLKRVAQGGTEEYYRGDTAREMVRALEAAGGLYQLEEFAQHETEWYEPPISTTYRGYTVYGTAPPSQGFLVLEMLNLLEGFDLAGMGFYNADVTHAMVEAKKLAFADRNRYMRDPAVMPIPLDELISKEFADRRRRDIDPDRAASKVEAGPLAAPVAGDGNTSYFCVIDGEGNAVSFIHSLSSGFTGSFVAGSTGVLMNNRVGRGFSLVEGHPNVIEPGKRTMHTLNAYMIFDGDKPYMIGGTPGGDRQPQWNVQVITSVIDYGMDVMEALSAPKWVSMPGTDPATIDDPMTLDVGYGMEPGEVEKLRAKGHSLTELPAGAPAGSSKLIMVDPDTGVRMGGVDPRSDGQVAVV